MWKQEISVKINKFFFTFKFSLFLFSGVRTPTPIQKGCISKILAGDDCIGAAKTGSGKTFAFALPILQHLAEDPYGIFALVLTPTHELAYQVNGRCKIVSPFPLHSSSVKKTFRLVYNSCCNKSKLTKLFLY